MKSKLIFCLALALSSGLFGCSTMSRQPVAKLNLEAFRIEKVPNENPTPYDGPDWKEWQNVLVISNSNIRVPLARSATAQSDLHYGFDPASLRLRWLKPDELLLISWTTFYQGSGGYTHDGNVILQIQGNQSRELFRDYIESVAKGGWAAQYFSKLEIACDDAAKRLQLTRKTTEINGDMGTPTPQHPYPFITVFTNDGGGVGWISKVQTVDTWYYAVGKNKLNFLCGNSAVDLDDETQLIKEIEKGFHISRAALELMNPNIRGQDKVKGFIVLDKKLKPYEISSDDGLGGDK